MVAFQDPVDGFRSQAVIFGGSQNDAGPYSEAPNASAGQITQTIANNPGQIQLALKIIF